MALLICAAVGIIAGCERLDHPAPDAESETEIEFPAITFTDVTAEAGLSDFRHRTGAAGDKWFPETMGSGGAFIDYNGNGRLDILLVGGGTWEKEDPDHHALWLYRNNGDGTFTLQTEEAGLADVDAYGFGVIVADYNNNGRQDFYLTTLYENKLFRNDGGTFTEIGEEAGVAGAPVWSSSAVFFDANRNGYLDLYVGNYVDWSLEHDLFCTLSGEVKAYCTPEEYHGIPGRFYRNNGDGTFTDVTEEVGFGNSPGKTLGVVEADFNRNGWPDLAVANDLERDLLFLNNGDGTFREVGTESGIAYDQNGRARAGMGIDAGVIDTTGQETIFVSNFSNEMVSVFRHVRDGFFADRAAVSQIGQPSLLTLGFGLFLFDVNYNGHLDFFLANGHVQADISEVRDGVTFRQPPQLFLNQNGDGTFRELDPGEGILSTPLVARGAAYGDINNDGSLHVLITENGGPVHLWRNDTDRGHYLRVHLEGTESNRDGIGTRIVAVVDGRQMERRVRSGSSYLSQNEKTVTFGLKDAPHVDSLVVYWPSGQVDEFLDLEADQTLRIVEGMGERTPVAAGSPSISP